MVRDELVAEVGREIHSINRRINFLLHDVIECCLRRALYLDLLLELLERVCQRLKVNLEQVVVRDLLDLIIVAQQRLIR